MIILKVNSEPGLASGVELSLFLMSCQRSRVGTNWRYWIFKWDYVIVLRNLMIYTILGETHCISGVTTDFDTPPSEENIPPVSL